MVAHNAGFDMSFIMENCRRLGISAGVYLCGYRGHLQSTVEESVKAYLDAVAKTLGISPENHHRAVDDAGVYGTYFCEIY